MGVLYNALSTDDKALIDNIIQTLQNVRPYDFNNYIPVVIDNLYGTYPLNERTVMTADYLQSFDSTLITPFNSIASTLGQYFTSAPTTRKIHVVKEFRSTIESIIPPDISVWKMYNCYLRKNDYIEGGEYSPSNIFDTNGNPIKKYFIDDNTYYEYIRSTVRIDNYNYFPIESEIYTESLPYFINLLKTVIEYSNSTPTGRRCEIISMSDLEEILVANSKFITYRDNEYWKNPLDYNSLETYLESQIRNDANRQPLYTLLYSTSFAITRYIHDYFKNYNYELSNFKVIPDPATNTGYNVGDKLYTPYFTEALTHYSTISGSNTNLTQIFESNQSIKSTLYNFKVKFIEEYPDKTSWLNPLNITKLQLETARSAGGTYDYYNIIPNILKIQIKNNLYTPQSLSNIDVIFHEMYIYGYYQIKYIQYFHTNYFKTRYIVDDLYFSTLKTYLSYINDSSTEYILFKRYITSIDIDEFKDLFSKTRTYHIEQNGAELVTYPIETFRFEVMTNQAIINYVKTKRYLNNESYFSNLLSSVSLGSNILAKINDFYGLYRHFVLELIEIYQSSLSLNLDPLNIIGQNYYITVHNKAYLGDVYNKVPVINSLPTNLSTLGIYVHYLKPTNELIRYNGTGVDYYTVENEQYIHIKNDYVYINENYKSFLFKYSLKIVKFNLPPLNSVYSNSKIYRLKSNLKPYKIINNIKESDFILLEDNVKLKSVNNNINQIYNYAI